MVLPVDSHNSCSPKPEVVLQGQRGSRHLALPHLTTQLEKKIFCLPTQTVIVIAHEWGQNDTCRLMQNETCTDAKSNRELIYCLYKKTK